MRNLRKVDGYYGVSRPHPTTIYIYDKPDDSRWYTVEGSTNINRTLEPIETGTNVENLTDFDTITADSPVNSPEDLEKEVDE